MVAGAQGVQTPTQILVLDNPLAAVEAVAQAVTDLTLRERLNLYGKAQQGLQIRVEGAVDQTGRQRHLQRAAPA